MCRWIAPKVGGYAAIRSPVPMSVDDRKMPHCGHSSTLPTGEVAMFQACLSTERQQIVDTCEHFLLQKVRFDKIVYIPLDSLRKRQQDD
jgi:hypothetical protein